VSQDELQARESDLAEQQNRLRNLQREALAIERELSATRRDRESSRARFAGQRGELERSILAAQQELTQLDALRRIVVTAPQAGRISLVRADVGQSVDANEVIAHVVPQGTPLVARLYVPSRAAGFVRTGDRVLLRYDAFPYQRFGLHEGRVLSVSTSAASRAELGDINPPDGITESLFAVQIALPEQAIGGQGNVPRQPLQAGLRVEGDLLQETRRLYQWMIEPLSTVTQKVAPVVAPVSSETTHGTRATDSPARKHSTAPAASAP
jgi:membrane fusion protein